MSGPLESFSRAEVDAAIEVWGTAQSEAMRGESRIKLSSELFDIRGRTWVGFECYYRGLPEILTRLAERMAPEEIGRRMKRPGCRPYYMQLFLLMSNYLCAREQRLLADGVAPEADPAAARDLQTMVEFCARVTRAYREDGELVPAAPRHEQRILDSEWVGRCAELLRPPVAAARIRRALASISLYLFLVHGEQRDGSFHHGPYELEDGSRMLVHEVNDLANEYLPWVDADRSPALDNLCFAYALRDVDLRFTLFAGCVSDPSDFGERVERLAVLTVEGERLRPVPVEELEELAAAALRLQAELYARVVEWPAIERTRYGTWLYANHVVPFLRIADSPDLIAPLTERFRLIGQAAAEQYLATTETPPIFRWHATLPEGSMFSRLAGP